MVYKKRSTITVDHVDVGADFTARAVSGDGTGWRVVYGDVGAPPDFLGPEHSSEAVANFLVACRVRAEFSRDCN